jgi:hypothetical protein
MVRELLHGQYQDADPVVSADSLVEAQKSAYRIIYDNNLYSALGLIDLTKPDQKIQANIVADCISERLLEDELSGITARPLVLQFSGVIWEKLGLDRRQKITQALNTLMAQKERYYLDDNICLHLRRTKMIMEELFEMVKIETGKTINPDRQIPFWIIRIWETRIS